MHMKVLNFGRIYKPSSPIHMQANIEGDTIQKANAIVFDRSVLLQGGKIVNIIVRRRKLMSSVEVKI